LSEPEALLLFRSAREARGGCLLNLAPCNDKAAVALVVGLASHPVDRRQRYYCVSPDGPAPNGAGPKAPNGREALHENLKRMGCQSLGSLMLTPSSEELAAWREPVALLRLQSADYDSMRVQVDRWLPHLIPGASLMIQGPVTDKAGRKRLITELQSQFD